MKRNKRKLTPRKPTRLELLTHSTATSHVHFSTHEVERRRDLEQARRNSLESEVQRLTAELAHAKTMRSESDAIIAGLDAAACR